MRKRAALMYAALEDGKPKSRRELFAHADGFYMTNNAASELRDALRSEGKGVAQWYADGEYHYQLVDLAPPAPEELLLAREIAEYRERHPDASLSQTAVGLLRRKADVLRASKLLPLPDDDHPGNGPGSRGNRFPGPQGQSDASEGNESGGDGTRAPAARGDGARPDRHSAGAGLGDNVPASSVTGLSDLRDPVQLRFVEQAP